MRKVDHHVPPLDEFPERFLVFQATDDVVHVLVWLQMFDDAFLADEGAHVVLLPLAFGQPLDQMGSHQPGDPGEGNFHFNSSRLPRESDVLLTPKPRPAPGKPRKTARNKSTAQRRRGMAGAVTEFIIMKRDGFEVNRFFPGPGRARPPRRCRGGRQDQGFSIAAWAAARMAVGTRKGEQLT